MQIRRKALAAAVGALTATALLAAPSLASNQAATMRHEAQGFEGVAAKAPANGAAGTFAPCVGGMAAGTYPCDGIDMMSHLSLADLGVSFVNDIWGWTDPARRRTTRWWAQPREP